MIAFTKMHGLGNDYVHIDCFEQRIDGADVASLARTMSDRHRGIGADGLILILPPIQGSGADARMEMYNADGSRAEMCGNGIRCVAKYVIDHGLAAGGSGNERELKVLTDRGELAVRALLENGKVDRVRVDMGPPVLEPSRIPVKVNRGECVRMPLIVGDARFEITCVSMGNPHAVCFVDAVDAVDLARRGPAVERHSAFPNRVNFHIAEPRSRNEVAMRSWERGSGLTQACGTGACAVLVAGVLEGRLDREAAIHLPGGDLTVEWADAAPGAEDVVFMTGPAVEVFSGDWPT